MPNSPRPRKAGKGAQKRRPAYFPPDYLPKLTGRPPKLTYDPNVLKQITGLARLQCTQLEASSVFSVSLTTFKAFLAKHAKAREAWDMGRPHGGMTLRRAQFEKAMAGDTSMLIWLGKQYLAQKDKTEHSDDPANPVGLAAVNAAAVLAKLAEYNKREKPATTASIGMDRLR